MQVGKDDEHHHDHARQHDSTIATVDASMTEKLMASPAHGESAPRPGSFARFQPCVCFFVVVVRQYFGTSVHASNVSSDLDLLVESNGPSGRLLECPIVPARPVRLAVLVARQALAGSAAHLAAFIGIMPVARGAGGFPLRSARRYAARRKAGSKRLGFKCVVRNSRLLQAGAAQHPPRSVHTDGDRPCVCPSTTTGSAVSSVPNTPSAFGGVFGYSQSGRRARREPTVPQPVFGAAKRHLHAGDP